MPQPPGPATPLPAPSCPLCGGPNGCAVAAAGCFEVACWCANAVFAPPLLASVPAASHGRACICRRCAEGAAQAADAAR